MEVNCLATNTFQNIFFRVQQMTENCTGLGQPEGVCLVNDDRIFIFGGTTPLRIISHNHTHSMTDTSNLVYIESISKRISLQNSTQNLSILTQACCLSSWRLPRS